MPNYGWTEWYFQLIDGRTKKTINDDTGRYRVFTADDANEGTIYSGQNGTTAMDQNGVTTTDKESTLLQNGTAHWFMDDATTTVDLVVQTANGHAFWIPCFAPSDHGLVVWPAARTSVNQISLFIGGLSGETARVRNPSTGEMIILRKTLQRDYLIRGDALARGSKPVELRGERWVLR